jgi:hypothetical protein
VLNPACRIDARKYCYHSDVLAKVESFPQERCLLATIESPLCKNRDDCNLIPETSPWRATMRAVCADEIGFRIAQGDASTWIDSEFS